MEYPRAPRNSCSPTSSGRTDCSKARGSQTSTRKMPCVLASSTGATPTTVNGEPLMVIARPSTEGSPPNSESHTALLMTATAAGSTASNPRPWTGLDSSVSK